MASWSVDDPEELDKLSAVPKGTEIAVRFALPVAGAAYDFGDKFGATPEQAADLLRRVANAGWTPALSFHPGTQCEDLGSLGHLYRRSCKNCEGRRCGYCPAECRRWFAANRSGIAPDLAMVFQAITDATHAAFGTHAPAPDLRTGTCDGGRMLTLATRVKALRKGGERYF